MPTANTSTQASIFSKLAYFVFLLGAFSLPLAFTSFFSNSFEFPKWIILISIALLGLLLWALESLRLKKIILPGGALTKSLGALALVAVLATLINSPNRISSLWGKTGFILAAVIFYSTSTVLLGKKIKHLFWSLLASSFLVSWIAIFAYLEILPKIFPNLILMASKRFSSTGGSLTLISFLAVLLPATLVLALKKKDNLLKLLFFVLAAIQTTALILTISLLMKESSTNPVILLPYSAGWSIAVDQFKTIRTALLGVGTDNFLSAFTQFRPAELNRSNLWNIRFTSSSNEIFTLLTTTGLLGLAALVWVYVAVIRLLRRPTNQVLNLGLKISLALILLTFLIIPANTVLLFTFFCLVAALNTRQKLIKLTLKPQLIALISLVLVLIVGALDYLTYRVIAAERLFTKSLQAANQSNGTATYNLQIKTIKLNPFESRYRIAYANTNLALANNLATKKEVSSEERETITLLVSQTIREAKNATVLDPKNPATWENLANVYRQLINFAQGADNWALTTYIQAVKLDPTNPRLRIDLGGLLYALQSYDAAIDQFKRAIQLKSDFANAYYNLSYAYKQKGDYSQAVTAMQTVVNLIDKDSTDFDKASRELEELQSLLPEKMQTATQAAQKKTGELNPPQPLPSPNSAGTLQMKPQEKETLAPQIITEPENPEAEPLPSPEL